MLVPLLTKAWGCAFSAKEISVHLISYGSPAAISDLPEALELFTRRTNVTPVSYYYRAPRSLTSLGDPVMQAGAEAAGGCKTAGTKDALACSVIHDQEITELNSGFHDSTQACQLSALHAL